MFAFRVRLGCTLGLHGFKYQLLPAIKAAAGYDEDDEEEIHEQDEVRVRRANFVAL